MICNSLKKIKLASVLFVYSFFSLNPLIAQGSRDYLVIDMLVRSCYKDIKFCNEALFKIHNYQKTGAIDKKLSCQTRLLGLEANLIMAINSNFKKKEAKSIIEDIKKYC